MDSELRVFGAPVGIFDSGLFVALLVSELRAALFTTLSSLHLVTVLQTVAEIPEAAFSSLFPKSWFSSCRVRAFSVSESATDRH